MFEQYTNINVGVGVELRVSPDNSLQISACSVALHKNKLDIVKKNVDLHSLEELSKHYSAKSIIALNITGKGVLTKQVERVEVINQQNFASILPNANPGDFYIQNFISGDYSFISLIRKVDAGRYINHLEKLGFIPLILSLGIFSIYQIIPQLNIYEQDFVLNNHQVRRNEKSEWLSVSANAGSAAFPMKIESELLDEKLIVAYANAFQLVLANKLNLIKADVGILENQYHAQIADKKFKLRGAILLGVFFVLLLINFLLFSWLNATNAQLMEKVSLTNQSTINTKSMIEEIRRREETLGNLGWDGGISKANLVDQLAAILPAELTWNEIDINPVNQAANRIQKTLTFNDRQINISGYSLKIIPVNEWIERIKTKSWVKTVQLDSYSFNNELNTGEFTVTVKF